MSIIAKTLHFYDDILIRSRKTVASFDDNLPAHVTSFIQYIDKVKIVVEVAKSEIPRIGKGMIGK